jgi:hypothetical protein
LLQRLRLLAAGVIELRLRPPVSRCAPASLARPQALAPGAAAAYTATLQAALTAGAEGRRQAKDALAKVRDV